MNNTDSQSSNNISTRIALDVARLDLLVKQAPTAIIASVVLSSMVIVLLWNDVSRYFIYSWLAVSAVIAISRLFLTQYIKNKLLDTTRLPQLHHLKAYEIAFSVGIFFNGVLLGWLGLIIDPNWPASTKFIVPFFIAGMTAGALSSNASSLSSYFSFTSPILLLLIYGLQKINMPFAAFLVVAYLVLMIVTSKRINLAFVEGMKLRIQNMELIEDLKQNNLTQAQLLQTLQSSERLSSGAFNQSGVAMGLLDKQTNFFRVNKAICQLTGYTETELISGMSMLALSHRNDQSQSKILFEELVYGSRRQYQLRKRYVKKDGTDVWVLAMMSSVLDDAGNFEYAVLHAQDINLEQKLNQQLTFQADHDALTQLPNRYAFEKQLQNLLDSQNHEEHVLCYIDLDQFKVVNDTSGHAAGDELLQHLSKILKQGLRKSDFLSRIGGDEFAILMFACSIDSAKIQLNQLLTKIHQFTFIYQEQSFKIGASMGLTLVNHNSTLTDVLKQADSACFIAKKTGRDRLHVYTDDDQLLARHTDEMHWVSIIQNALAENKFVLYSQQIVETDLNGDLPHCELLIRMIAEDGAIIPPGMFLPAAERYNLAAAIDLWVVEQVINTLNTARAEGKNIRGIYGVNLSGRSLGDERFYNKIIDQIGEQDFNADEAYICFEITETAAISNMETALHFITELRKLGCKFALDDFGSGLSSFAYLKQLQIDYLKIDGMFVKDCLIDPVNLEMIKSINGIGHVMGLKTIAEFVENKAIFNKLGEIGVDYAQGYWNGVPEPWVC